MRKVWLKRTVCTLEKEKEINRDITFRGVRVWAWDEIKGKRKKPCQERRRECQKSGQTKGKKMWKRVTFSHTRRGWSRENNDSNQEDFRSLSLFAQDGSIVERKRYRERERIQKDSFLEVPFYTTSVAGSVVQLWQITVDQRKATQV